MHPKVCPTFGVHIIVSGFSFFAKLLVSEIGHCAGWQLYVFPLDRNRYALFVGIRPFGIPAARLFRRLAMNGQVNRILIEHKLAHGNDAFRNDDFRDRRTRERLRADALQLRTFAEIDRFQPGAA